ncbi:MAG: AraC family transcriptional regulator [Flavobacteriales bacterium]|nr:AraC family transcriptional regulator [Flavobacteriales bacterium]
MKEDIHPKMYLYKRIVEAKLFIDRNYAQKIELENISSEASFSKYHFLRLFKQAYGKSPHQYLTEVRISAAKRLLEKGDAVGDVCYAVGFDSIPSFTRLFKKQMGISPKQFSLAQQKTAEQKAKQPFQFIPNCFAESNGWNK